MPKRCRLSTRAHYAHLSSVHINQHQFKDRQGMKHEEFRFLEPKTLSACTFTKGTLIFTSGGVAPQSNSDSQASK